METRVTAGLSGRAVGHGVDALETLPIDGHVPWHSGEPLGGFGIISDRRSAAFVIILKKFIFIIIFIMREWITSGHASFRNRICYLYHERKEITLCTP
jgi:hypothetical protein